MFLIFLLFVSLKAKEDELKGQQEVEEVRKLLNEKTEYVKALEAQLAERPPKDDVITKMEKYESVQKTHQNLIHELTMKLRQQNASNGELINLVDNLKEELRELHYLKAQSDAGNYKGPHCVILSVTMLVHFFLITNILLST
jgi:flagellar biosynthesis/type III secretory pathway chaperone